MKFLKRELVFCVALVNLGGNAIKNPKEWIKYTEDQIRGNSSKAEISMNIKTPNWERNLEISVDALGRDKALTFIKSPAKEKGIGTLRLKNKMWNYFPKLKRKVTVSPSMLLSSWMGSDFTNDDLLKASSMADDYSHKFLKDEVVDGETYRVIEGTAKSDALVIWPRIEILSSPKDCLPRYQRYYNKNNELLRVLKLSNIQKHDGHLLPTKWEMQPSKDPDKKTTLQYNKIKYDVKFSTKHFTLRKLTGK